MITWDPSEEISNADLAAGNDELISSSRVKILDLGLASFKSEMGCTTMQTPAFRQRARGGMRTMRTMRATKRGSFVEMAAAEVCGFKGIRAPEMWASEEGDGIVRFDAKTDVSSAHRTAPVFVLLQPC